MNTLTFRISEEQEAELRGGRIALLTSDGADIALEWYYPGDPTGHKTILLGKVINSSEADLAHWWHSEEGKKRREEAIAHYKEFKKSHGL
jgi:hypothetical protein